MLDDEIIVRESIAENNIDYITKVIVHLIYLSYHIIEI
jgi:hypothetical protein